MQHLKWIFLLYLVPELRAVPLLVSFRTTMKVLESEGSNNITLQTNITGYSYAADFHFKRGDIYFADQSNKIYRSKLGGSHASRTPVSIVEGRIYALAVDWVNDKLYWGDSDKNTIEMANLDGLNRSVLYTKADGIDTPRSMVVDPNEGFLFWSDSGLDRIVVVSKLDGTEKTNIVSNFRSVYGLALDIHTKNLYLADYLKKLLWVYNYGNDGSNLHVVSTSLSSWDTGITYYSNKLYWSDGNGIYSFNTLSNNTDTIYTFKKHEGYVTAKKVIHASLQPQPCGRSCQSSTEDPNKDIY